MRRLPDGIWLDEIRAEPVLEHPLAGLALMPDVRLALFSPGQGQRFQNLKVHRVIALRGVVHHICRLQDVNADAFGPALHRQPQFAQRRRGVTILPVHARRQQARGQVQCQRLVQVQAHVDQVGAAVNLQAAILFLVDVAGQIRQVAQDGRALYPQATRNLGLCQAFGVRQQEIFDLNQARGLVFGFGHANLRNKK